MARGSDAAVDISLKKVGDKFPGLAPAINEIGNLAKGELYKKIQGAAK